MDGRSTLTWEALRQTGGDIPWPALYGLAAAVVVDPLVVDRLIDLYEQGVDSDYGIEHYEEFYVPAIFALAAPQLSGERRLQIGRFLLEKLAEAGYEDDDLLMEVLMAACGSMDAEILPMVLQTIADEPDDRGAWFYLWGLTELAAKTDDAQIRQQVIQACTNLLQQADRGEIDLMCAIDAAWTLARMKHTDSLGLLRRLKDKSKKSFCEGDYSEALDLLRGCPHYTPTPNLWERPVEEWFEPRWRMARDWYAKNARQNDEDEIDAGRRRAEDLAKRFLKSADRSDLEGFSPPIPIVEQSPKIGRNDPCPCGSGRKYKKCCGNVKKASIDL